MTTIPITVRADRFQCYRGMPRAAFKKHNIGVWSEVNSQDARAATEK